VPFTLEWVFPTGYVDHEPNLKRQTPINSSLVAMVTGGTIAGLRSCVAGQKQTILFLRYMSHSSSRLEDLPVNATTSIILASSYGLEPKHKRPRRYEHAWFFVAKQRRRENGKIFGGWTAQRSIIWKVYLLRQNEEPFD